MAGTNGTTSNEHGNAKDVSYRDPAVYAEYEKKWTALPQDEAGWLRRAQEVADVLAVDAVVRDAENKSPRAEVALLKYAGLLKVLGPKKYGGGGEPWSVGYKLIRKVAEADGSIGMLLGYHLLWSTTADVVGSAEQADRFQKLIIENNYFIGGAVNPRDSDLSISSDGDKIVFNGFKHFNTGGVISDLTVLEGVYEGTDHHIFAFAATDQPGIQFSHNWNNIGLRLTESGSVKISNVAVPWTDALGWNVAEKKPDAAALQIPFASLLLPSIQLVFSNFYLGIALGAQDYASKYTLKGTRAWPYGGDNKDKATEEFYILERYGNFHAHLRAAVALADRAGEQANDIYKKYSGDLATRAKLTARERGEFAEWVASTKVVTTDTGLRVTAGVFEVTGAKATSQGVGLDRFWRDVRTHTLHDPVSYKNRELGRFQLLDEIPEPTWYT
ncbi:acyl-CoA dehydrogenase NM domain-like protein [Cucurbitaria berberidis CBS 394.84]|uniref:Acyl-CoA dehydrogenase NM domain-like protein n=1 Tax=Cucurbitaria berberidis CBS 394.84 TaxID=1168544 RepID=A0A9P4GNH6_9PLEO|nr:acyl-CoA dehydrogenase NM domain-like protein [Cucurbitaria berberidis CBS 394.84]KAF1848912.1 acyl-CoA dehydrogenase NM domain-like protein [Cucurbitaria berberidis CBS 394.84]